MVAVNIVYFLCLTLAMCKKNRVSNGIIFVTVYTDIHKSLKPGIEVYDGIKKQFVFLRYIGIPV